MKIEQIRRLEVTRENRLERGEEVKFKDKNVLVVAN